MPNQVPIIPLNFWIAVATYVNRLIIMYVSTSIIACTVGCTNKCKVSNTPSFSSNFAVIKSTIITAKYYHKI